MKFRLFNKVHWWDKLLDVLVVVLGITIAFWLNNWQESRKNRASEQKYLVALQNDLSKDSVSLLAKLEVMDTILFGIDKMIKISDEVKNADSITQYLMLMGYDEVIFFPEDYSYKSLQQSGDIGLIQNDSILLLLAQLYDNYELFNVFNELAYEWQLRDLQPYFKNFDSRQNRVIDQVIYTKPEFFYYILRYQYNVLERDKLIREALEKIRILQEMISKDVNVKDVIKVVKK